jgi:hypothetical protein
VACLLQEHPPEVPETKKMNIMTAGRCMLKKNRSVGRQMSNKIPIRLEDTNIEVLAMIVKAASRKFDCSMEIDFTNGNRKVEFVGNDFYKPLIVEEVEEIFSKDGG